MKLRKQHGEHMENDPLLSLFIRVSVTIQICFGHYPAERRRVVTSPCFILDRRTTAR